jgi:topoisomerase IV subunit B
MLKFLGNAEITRFKGLGEISPDEFGFMIGPDMRLDLVGYEEGKGVKELLAFYMGKNTPECQDYIIENLGSHSARSGAFQAPL